MKPLSVFRRILTIGLAFIAAGSFAAVQAQQAAAQTQAWTAQQIDDLVAPIALYPDPLLGQVLAASTYPLEIVEAQQWLKTNGGLTGTSLMDAVKQQNWDPSVQALAAFPDVLARLNQDVRWTTDLGNAFLAQPADVMQAVQRMRASAKANGKLSSSQQEVVTTQTDNGQSAIEIEPANPQVINVPYYDPEYIWGPPAWGYYPALYYPSFGFGFWPGINVGFYFGGWGSGPWASWGSWGWGPNWFGGGLFVNGGFFRGYGFHGYGGFAGTAAWAHNPAHRLGVGYANSRLTQRYGAASRANASTMGSRFTGSNSFRGANNFSGANRSAMQGSVAARGGQYANRSTSGSYSRGPTANRSMASRPSYSRSYQSRPSVQSAPRYSAPRSSAGQSFGGGSRSFGGGARSFGGGGGHSFGGGGHSGGGGGRRR